jgi:DNA polymerase-3 subunit gamma/tau
MAKKKSKRFIIPASKKEKLSIPTRSKSLEKPKPLTVKPGERRNSALSLSSLKRNKEEEEEHVKKNKEEREQQKDLPKDPFTEETFMEVWNTYVNDLHTKGEKILASILKADTPKLAGTQIHVTYPNELMKVELLKVRPKVLRYIRKKLNNFEVDFQISVNEDTTKRFAYTPQEKYELLKEKNEAISLLRKKFNLEL